jgi:hypothetical protein
VHSHLQDYRGLIASDDLSPGDVVVSVPLHNTLQVPRQLTGTAAGAAAAAAATALDRWQQQHGALPGPLLDLILGAQTQHVNILQQVCVMCTPSFHPTFTTFRSCLLLVS